MKTLTRPNPNSGHLLLAFVLLIACVLIVVVALKILHTIQSNPPSPWHGEDTNDITKVDTSLTNVTAALREALGSNAVVQVEIQELDVTLPMTIDQLGSVWYEQVQHSTNFIHWSPTALEWSEALAINRTNHPGQQGWFRRVILY